LTNEPQNIY